MLVGLLGLLGTTGGACAAGACQTIGTAGASGTTCASGACRITWSFWWTPRAAAGLLRLLVHVLVATQD